MRSGTGEEAFEKDCNYFTIGSFLQGRKKGMIRFVLSHPSVDLCLTGTRNTAMMRENLKTLELGPLNEKEMKRVRRIGDYVYGEPRN